MPRRGRNIAEIQLPLDLHIALKSKRLPCILATFSDLGLPHASLVNLIYPKGSSSILLTIDKRHMSYENMVWQKKITLCFLDKNFSYSILGRAGVIQAPSEFHPEMNIVRIDVIQVHRETLPLVRIDNGMKISARDATSGEIESLLMDELKVLAEQL